MTRVGRMDEIKVIVERRDNVNQADATNAATGLKQRIKTIIGISSAVEIARAGGVERSLGKAKRIRDLRNNKD